MTPLFDFTAYLESLTTVAFVIPAVIALVIAPVLPEEYWDRMGSILVSTDQLEAEDTDRSIRSRIHYWRVALIMAEDNPFLGVGTSLFNSQYDRYDFSGGEYMRRRSVHSTWLGILCEAGVPGLLLEIWLIGYAFLICWRTRRLAKHRPEFANIGIYASAIEAALIAFCVGGTLRLVALRILRLEDERSSGRRGERGVGAAATGEGCPGAVEPRPGRRLSSRQRLEQQDQSRCQDQRGAGRSCGAHRLMASSSCRLAVSKWPVEARRCRGRVHPAG